MSTVLILEDNIMQLNALATIIENNLEQVTVLKASDYNTAQLIVEQNQIQFFLLDVELEANNPNARTGIDFGKYIRTFPQYKFSPILFITSIPEQIQVAVNQIHCQNYILKPYTTEELLEAIHFLFKTPFLEPAPIKLCDNNGVYYKIPEKDVLYIEASGKEMILHVISAEHNKVSQLSTNRYRLIELKKMLSDNFLQCHRKYIVNINYIVSYDKTTCSIHIGKFLLPVGRKYKRELEEKYLPKE